MKTVASKETFEKIIGMLVELKDSSEIMMDLAYSSILFNSEYLAREVRMLEERMDMLHTEFSLLVLTLCTQPEDTKHLLGLIRLGLVTEMIADAAADIADVVLRGLEPHQVLKLAIKEAAETVTHVHVSNESILVGKSLREAQVHEETGMWILVVKRGDKWIRPKSDTVIHAGDLLIASGYAKVEGNLRALASDELHRDHEF